jgi:multicomponent Na+:H+ antiporter subunit C
MNGIGGHYSYWITILLMVAGMYILIARGNLLKKLLGGTAPIVAEGYTVYSNPLPHVLILTAIVVGVATLALGLAIVVRIREAYGTIEEDEILAHDGAAENRTDDGAR